MADESADWKIAGLRQLDRLALTLNEFAQKNNDGSPLVVCVQWDPSVDASRRWMPNDSRLTAISLADDASGMFDETFNTRQLVQRNTLARESVSNANKIVAAERRFLRGSGKSQDGLVSRYLNRPISRAVTQRLLRTHITPNEWSILILPLVVLAAFFLRHGTYGSILFGLLLFQVFSILDGCDGEIARAKFMESTSGRLLDDLSDILCNVLLGFGLGLGLGKSHRWLFIEGLVTVLLIGLNELILTKTPLVESETEKHSLGAN
ncbi:MAG: CDP-alcohol phosphatidyltransferase family protein, partial [Verrucomicrobiota bacterium]|nr:CDP-alcohol phosphatidyltransferase family protein [Verrucomicrobiota bacterium]